MKKCHQQAEITAMPSGSARVFIGSLEYKGFVLDG